MAIKSFLSEGGFSVGSVGSAPIEVIDSSGNITAVGLTVSGNLVVNGSTTTINSTTTTLDDPIFTLGGDTVPTSDDNKDRGIEFRWHDGSLAKVGFFGFDDSTGKFVFIPNATNTSEVFSGTKGTIDANLEWADVLSKPSPVVTVTLTGDVTGTANATLTSLGNGTVTISTTVAADSVALGTDTTGNYVASITNGSYITGGNGGSEGAALTLAVDATSANTASKVVARDASGNFSAGSITATGMTVRGAANLTQLVIDTTTSGSKEIVFRDAGTLKGYVWNSGSVIGVGGGSGANSLFVDPSTGNTAVGANTIPAGARLLVDGGYGIIVNGTAGSSYSSGIKFRNDGYTHFTAGVKGSSFVIAQTDSEGTVVWQTTPLDRFTINSSGNTTLSGTLTVNGAEAAIYGADGYQLKLGYSSAYFWKIGRAANGSLIFNDSSGDRVIFTNTGNVGIGVSPGTRLNVKEENSGTEGFIVTNWNNVNTVLAGSDSISGGGKFTLKTNGGTSAVFISSTASSYFNGGSVGVGTSSPGAKLEISEAAGATNFAALKLTNATGAVNANVDLFMSAAGNAGGVKLRAIAPGSNHNDLAMYVTNAGTLQATPAIFIQGSTNKVGINRSDPSNTLDVSGSVRTTDWYYVENSGNGMYNNANAMWWASHGSGSYSLSSNTTFSGIKLFSGGSQNTFRGHFYGDSAGQGFLDSSGNWALQLDSSKRLQVYSGVYSIENGTIRVFNPGGATYSDGPALTGAFKIKLPTATYNSNTMMTLVVDIYNYDTGKSLRFRVGGYNYQTGDWYNTFAEQTSDLGVAAYNVRFGSDGTSNCIWIGETNSSWSYPKVYVSEFLGGHGSATAAWASGWAITRVTAFDTVVATRNASVGVNNNNIGTYGVSSITGTSNQVIASASTGAVTLSLPQSIATTSTPTFGGGTLNGTLTVVKSNGGNVNGSANAAIYLSQDESSIQGPGTNTVIRMGGNLVLGANSTWIATTNGTTALTINNSQNSTFAGNLTVNGTVTTLGTANGSNYILTPGTDTSTGVLALQAGQGSAGFGGGLAMFSGTHATYPGWTIAGLASGVSTAKFAVNSQGWVGAGTNVFTVDRSGNTVANGTLIVSSTTDATAAPAGSISASGGIAVGTNKKFMATGTGGYWGAPSVGNQETLLIRATGFGYNPTSYAGVQIGGTAGRSIVFGVDVSAIAGSQFTGAANEWIIPNTLNIRQVTSAGTDFSSAIFTIGNGGATTIGGNLTVSGTGTSSFAGSVNVDGGINFLRGSGDYSNYIKANDYVDGGYTGSTSKYWIELGAKGGTHIVLNTDGSATSAENAYDHFTIWQAVNGTGAIAAGARKFWITNTGRVNLINGLWHKSGDGIERFYYDTSGTSFYKGGGSGSIHVFRNSSDVDILTLSNAKDAILSGNLAVNGGTGTIDATSGTASATLNLVGRSSGTAKTASIASNSAGSLVLSAEGAGSALTIAANTGNTTVAYNLTVSGNLIINGTTTTVNSTTTTLDDPIITLGGDTAPTVDDNKDRGIEFKWYTGGAAKTGFFGFDDSTGYFTFIPDATNSSEVFSGTQGDIQAGVYRGTGASLTGSITESSADDQAITLNATDNSWKYLGFQWSGTRKAYFGINASGSPEWGSDVANATFAIVGSGSSLTIAGNTVLHAGNYNNYTDPIIQALDSKASVKAATTADITLSGTQTIDGVALVAGDRVLVKNQNTQTPNGIYVVSAGAWTRATDFDTWAKLIGAFVFVEQGSTNGLTGWLCAAAAGGAFGSNPIMFSQFSHGGSVNAGTGLTKTTNNVGSGPVSTFSIANTTVSPTSYGSASSVATFTVNAQGQLTAANSVAIAISSAAVSGLANSATTTATSANTANQIVLRDGSGNFSAGTITAALSGNATTATSASNITGGNQTGNYQVTSGQYTRFGHANQTDTNDGVIGAGIFASGLNIVGTQTVAAQGRVVRVWGNLMRDDGTQYVYNSGSWGINITGTASGETLSTVTGRGASTGSQISVATGSAGSMFTGTKVGSGYSDGVSGATFKSITDNPNGGSTAFAAYYGGSAGTNSFFVGAAGNAYFKDVVGIGTTSPVANLHVYRATNSTVGNLAEVATYSAVKIGKFRADQDHSLYIGNAGSYASFLQGANDAGSNSMNILINPFGSNVGIGTTSPGYKLEVNGSFAATTKSFVIKHPTKEGKKLRYGSLEGPENGVYVRGKLKGSNVIELPDYWTKLVDPESITVQLTPIGSHQKLYVEKIEDNKVYIANENLLAKAINCFFYVLAERCDVEKLEVEIDA